MNLSPPETLREEHVRELVQKWNEALTRHAPPDELHDYFANGLLVEVGDRALRGRTEFDAWYRAQPGGLAQQAGTGAVTVRLVSPRHAEAVVSAGPGRPGQSIGVVLQNGVVRIRTVTVHTEALVAA
ncbi:hypothetical protein [Micromonospora sp. WMMD714]|uniref:hypothetical protein n=1 Tax=Micromonospora sp. WMMD714 TaxID=3016097 RepID=UPI00249B2D02|nr:hypothetical protein [Micromonospora sp. WMMD714]WFE62832.1 hypothetical protein O7625_05810 [Micromonospora sp. WMMD714]